MPISVNLPPFRYFMVTWGVGAEFGGMTTMCLTRSRTMRQLAGIHAPVITFDFQPNYEDICANLLRAGHIVDSRDIVNIYHDYRSRDLTGRPSIAGQNAGESLAPLSDVQTQTVRDAEGLVFCRVVRTLDAETEIRREYFRKDGSPFLVEEAKPKAGSGEGRSISLLDNEGRCVAAFASRHEFYQAWMVELTGGEPSVFIVDSQQTIKHVGTLDADHIMKFAVFHNSHISGGGDPLRGKLAPGRRELTEFSQRWDGLLFLTERHRQDFIDRYGTANNLFCLSNPSPRADALPPFEQRTPHRGVMVCRLEEVKNVRAAIDVISIVRRSVPTVKLDVYGTGRQRQELQEHIEDLGLQENVELHGYLPMASAQFRTAAFSLLTSNKEGQPLALLESQGLGCPPVAYDIRYGPEDVLEDGVNGFLVPRGDIEAAAAAIIELCTDHVFAEKLSARAWEDSRKFGFGGVLQRLGTIVDKAWEQRTDRLEMDEMQFVCERSAILFTGELELMGRFTWDQSAGEPAEDLLSAELQIIPRKDGPAHSLPGEILSRAPGEISVRFLAGLDELGEGASKDDMLDAFVLVTGRNVLYRHRLEFSTGHAQWIPCSTAKGKLSLKAAPASS
ncbi:glycosyltransferase [Arthrobacter monumenti]